MRLVRIPDISYEVFAKIRDAILDNIPWCIIREGYLKHKKEAQFYFWDTDYIPPFMEQFIVYPPKHREDIEKLQKEITAAMEDTSYISTIAGYGDDKQPE